MTKIVVAVIACDFKAYSLERVIDNNMALESPPGVELLHYLNLERGYADADLPGSRMRQYLATFEDRESTDIDCWTWESSWRRPRIADQDQGHRLPPIVIARNMTLDYAKLNGADAVLYIDSDVVVPQNSVVELWKELNTPHGYPCNIVGGLVPGRGVHGHVYYTGSTGPIGVKDRSNLVWVDYGTAGFVMIHSYVFWNVPWRWGKVPDKDEWHSEDPLFAHDVRQLNMGRWYLRTDLEAEHLDNPDRPLMPEGTGRWE